MTPLWMPAARVPWISFDCDDESARCVLCGGHARRLLRREEALAFHARHADCANTPAHEQGEQTALRTFDELTERLGALTDAPALGRMPRHALLVAHPNDPLYESVAPPTYRPHPWYVDLVDRDALPGGLERSGRRGDARALRALTMYAAGVNGPDDGLLAWVCLDGHRVGVVVRWSEVRRWGVQARAARTLHEHLARRGVSAAMN